MNENLVGLSIGHYQLREIIGQGGMAIVYRASQPRIDRDVAIKVIAAPYARHPAFVRRFEQEMRATAHLQHPHILPVYDVGLDGDQLYMVMAYYSGGTLSRRIAGSPAGLPIEEILCVTIQVAAALDHAHRQGIIHRDVKPGNIMLDGRGNAYLGDFGIAQLADAEALPAFGTYAYMAPEIAEGRSASPASDIYSLGMVVAEMLAGHRPFEAHDRAALMEVYETHFKLGIRDARPELPPGIQVVLEQALSRDPVSRPAYASALAQALLRASGVTGLPCAETPRTPMGDEPAVLSGWPPVADDDDWDGDGPLTPPPFDDPAWAEDNPDTDPAAAPPPAPRESLPPTAVSYRSEMSVPMAAFIIPDRRRARVPMSAVLVVVWVGIILALLGLAALAVAILPSLARPAG